MIFTAISSTTPSERFSLLYTAIYTTLYGYSPDSGSGLWSPADLFLPGDEGVWFDLDDDMDEKIAFRRNLLTWSEGTNTQASGASGLDNAAISITGFTNSLYIPDNAIQLSYFPTVPLSVGHVCTYSIFVQMDDNSAPQIGSSASSDFQMWFSGIPLSDTDGNIESIGAGVYRVWFSGVILQAGVVGIRKNTSNSPKGFRVTGTQFERSALTEYQKVTDWNTEFLAQFPNHVLFQDSAGTTAVTAVEQPIGLVLDKSKGLVRGPEVMSDPSFDTGQGGFVTSASLTVSQPSSGKIRATKIAASGATGISEQAVLVAGKTYRLEYTITCGATPVTAFIGIWSPSSAPSITPLIPANSTVAYTMIVTPSGGVGNIRVGIAASENTGAILDYELVSVKELAGNHRTQATTGSKPKWSARKNQLTATESFNDASWILNSATQSMVLAPDSSMTAVSINMLADGNGFRSNAAQFQAGSVSTISVWMRSNVAGQTTVQSNNGIQLPAQVVNLTTEWVEHVFNTNGSSADSQFWFCRRTASETLADVQIWHPQLEYGSTATDYQRVNAATDYDAIGFPKFATYDGVDDGMVTGNIDFTATDKMTVCAGLTQPTGNPASIYLEFGPTGVNAIGENAFGMILNDTNDGTVEVSIGDTTGYGIYRDLAITQTPRTQVLTGIYNLGGATKTQLRSNSLPSTLTLVAGTGATSGNFGTYPLYFGRRGGTSLPFNGQENQTFVNNRILTAPEQEQLENFFAQKTGVVMP